MNRSAEAAHTRSWPGWRRGRRLAITVARGALWLAASHPGQGHPAHRRGEELADPPFRVVGEAGGLSRPLIEIQAIQPRNVVFVPSTVAVTPVPPLQWAQVTDTDDPLFIFWPSVPPRKARNAPPFSAAGPAGAALPESDATPGDDANSDAESEAESESDDESELEDESEFDDGESDDDDADAVPLPLRAVLFEPNGGEVWTADSTATIRWQVEGGEEPVLVRIELSLDDGRAWRLLADSLDNSGEFEWTIPWLESRKARLRIAARDDSGLVGIDASDAVFTLRRPAWAGSESIPLLAFEAGTRLPAATFRFVVELATAAPAELVILAVTGRLIRRLWDGPMTSGRQVVPWDGTDEGKGRAASGIYFARLTALGNRLVRRVVLGR